MTFWTTLERGEETVDAMATVSVQAYADAIGAPEEMRRRFQGELVAEVSSVVFEDGSDAHPTDSELLTIEREAVGRAARFKLHLIA